MVPKSIAKPTLSYHILYTLGRFLKAAILIVAREVIFFAGKPVFSVLGHNNGPLAFLKMLNSVG